MESAVDWRQGSWGFRIFFVLLVGVVGVVIIAAVSLFLCGDIDVEGDNQSTESRMSSVSGDIDTQNLSGEFRADSVSGDISVVDGAFDRLTGETVNGDIVFSCPAE